MLFSPGGTELKPVTISASQEKVWGRTGAFAVCFLPWQNTLGGGWITGYLKLMKVKFKVKS